MVKGGMGDLTWRPFIYGGVASIVAEFGTFPVDTTKTRLQIQGQTLDKDHAKLKYRGMVDCFFKIAKQEGFGSLYSGIWPAVLRQATYGTIKFGTYYSIKSIIVEHNNGEESVLVNILCAVIAGAFSSAIANPTDVLKVRMQVAGSNGISNVSLVQCFKEVYTHEGISGLWRGVSPTAQRAAVIAAIELPVYDFTKNYLMNLLGDTSSNHFISSLVASGGSAVGSTPLDVIRTRLMNQRKLKKGGKLSSHIYKGTIDCFIQTFRNEGFWAFYKGFIPTLFRMGPWNIIFFLTYEKLKQLY